MNDKDLDFKIVSNYKTPLGIPVTWFEESTGNLIEAVQAYIQAREGEGDLLGEDLINLLTYLKYYIEAPCWNLLDEHIQADIRGLKYAVDSLKDYEEIAAWLTYANQIGLDPL